MMEWVERVPMHYEGQWYDSGVAVDAIPDPGRPGATILLEDPHGPYEVLGCELLHLSGATVFEVRLRERASR